MCDERTSWEGRSEVPGCRVEVSGPNGGGMRRFPVVMAAVLAASTMPEAVHPTAGRAESVHNEELRTLFEADQADRQRSHSEIDWAVVSRRDAVRLRRVKELYHSGAVLTGKDWFRAALVLQHSPVADDHLLAHEMCIAALALGERSAASLAAATEDRFLRGIGRRQRFGTQYEGAGHSGPLVLAEIEQGVTDALRAVLDVPPLPPAGTEFPHGR